MSGSVKTGAEIGVSSTTLSRPASDSADCESGSPGADDTRQAINKPARNDFTVNLLCASAALASDANPSQRQTARKFYTLDLAPESSEKYKSKYEGSRLTLGPSPECIVDAQATPISKGTETDGANLSTRPTSQPAGASEEAGLHSGGSAHTFPHDRRQHLDLHLDQCRTLATPARH